MVLSILSSLNPAIVSPPGFKALGTNTAPKPLNGRIWSSVEENGVIYTCGTFSITNPSNSQTRRYVAAYTVETNTWSVLGNGYFVGTDLRQVFVRNGVVYVAGNFTAIEIGGSTLAASALVRYTISTGVWSIIGTGVSPSSGVYGRGVVVDSSATYLYFTATGMTSINGTSVTNIARITLSNNAVSAMTSNFPGVGLVDGLEITNSNVVYILTTQSGALYWSGTSWTTLGTGPPTNVSAYSIAFGPGGSTLVGYNNVVWYSADGSTGWLALGSSSGVFFCVAIDPVTGTLYSAATVASAPVRVWSGSTWTTFGAVSGGYVRTIIFSNQRMYLTGSYTTIGGITTTNAAAYY